MNQIQIDDQSPHEYSAHTKTYRLDCADHTDPRLINFYDPEVHAGKIFRWTKPVAMFRIDVPQGDYEVVIETSCLRGADCTFHFQLIWNDHVIAPRTIRVDNGTIRFAVEQSMFVSDREQRLTIACKALNAENGRRQLGMPISWIQLSSISSNHGLANQESPNRRQSRTALKPKFACGIKRLFRNSTPEPRLPIWQVEMPTVATALTPAVNKSLEGSAHKCETAIVSSVEINARHGTGLLIQYLIGDFSDVATVISQRCYNGDRVRSAAHYELPGGPLSRHQIYQAVLQWFKDSPPRRAYVVPFFESDMIVALALKDIFQTKICLHIMDDNCLYSDEIATATAEETIRKSDLCFAISPEMRNEYQQRFGMKIWVLPPIVPDHLISRSAQIDDPNIASPLAINKKIARRKSWLGLLPMMIRNRWTTRTGRARGILIGNIWDRSWLDLLRATVRESGLQLDWYCNNPEAVWLEESTANLDKDGIHLHYALWGKALVDELKRRPFAVMPSGRLADGEVRQSIARLSLPSRVPFVAATAKIPIIVLGHQETAAAKFVKRFQLGRVVDYDGEAFCDAAREVVCPETQQAIQHRADSISELFSNGDLNDWLWKSLDAQFPLDHRFEKAFAPADGEFAYFIDPVSPKQICWDKRPVWQMLRRLQNQGVGPELVIDVGASDGVWSSTAATVFPDAHFVLVDPLLSRYNPDHREHHLRSLKSHELVEAALSDRSGQTELLVSNDLYGSSLLNVNTKIRQAETATVDVLTLDELAASRHWSGRALIKLDVQFAEHLVINGGPKFIRDHVDAMILELTVAREHPHAKTYVEMLEMMRRMGFELVDEIEGWRNPQTGRLEQKDALFICCNRSALVRAA